ncbi:MAG TPA: NAD(P)/FAD-dependent oxidoreductase, partial [Thermoleophilia bacterium]|nr:NAD(P)/FAD-dependent oxidoreductase [Thermoleophilia bacterium]
MAALRHLLIGTGPAAVSAAETIRLRDEQARITMVAGEAHGYYSRPGLAYYLTGDVPEAWLFPFTAQDFVSLDIELVRGRAAHVDRAAHVVTLEDGRQLAY